MRWREIQNLVKLRIRRWLAGEISELWNDVLSEKNSRARLLARKKNKSTRSNLRKSNAIRARHAVEDGQYRKAIQALSSDGLAPDVIKEMESKHPQSLPPSIPPSQPQSPIELVDTQVIKALRSFPNGSAPGPSNLRATHLKEAVSCPSPGKAAHATQALTRVVSLLCNGHAPSQIVPHLCGATLLPIQKKGGGLRPIAVGEIMRRLTSKCLSKCVKDEAFHTLTPLQVGVGVKVGCETVVHAVSRIQEDPTTQPSDKWTLLLDFSNAFNSISRSHMFEEIQARIPTLTPWMESCYGTQPFLHLGDHTILSSSGVPFHSISGMEWWNGIVEWNTGMTLYLMFGGAMSYSTSNSNVGTSHRSFLGKWALFFPQLPAKLYFTPMLIVLTCESSINGGHVVATRMAERKVDWGVQASYCRLQAKIGLAIERSGGHHRLMSCTRSYGRSIIELLNHTTSFWRAGKYPRLVKANSSIPFHYSIPLFHSTDSRQPASGRVNMTRLRNPPSLNPLWDGLRVNSLATILYAGSDSYTDLH